MARLPVPGSDAGSWGSILNEYLSQVHNTDGSLKDNTVGAAQLKTDAVTTTQLADNSVTNAQLANNAVTTANVADGAITAAKLGNDVVLGGGTIADGSITTAKLADNAVTNAKVDAATRASLAKADSSSQPGHGHAIADVSGLQTALDGKQAAGSYVTTARTVNGHPLSADVTVTAGDVGAVPTTRTVNSKALSTDITLTASDVSAVPTTRTVNGKQLNADITLSSTDVGAATAAQGAKADSALQPGALATVATSGSYTDLTNKPSFGTAATLDVGTTAGTLAAGDDSRIVNAVPSSRTINTKPLTGDVTLTAADVSAVPATRTINSKPLSSDVTLTASDVGAATAAQGALAATAVQTSQIVSLTKRITGTALIITTSRTFCGKFLPPESSRGRLIVRNVGVNPITFQFGSSLTAEFNAPSFTGAPIIAVGQELVIDGSVYGPAVAPGADGTEIRALIYREVMI